MLLHIKYHIYSIKKSSKKIIFYFFLGLHTTNLRHTLNHIQFENPIIVFIFEISKKSNRVQQKIKNSIRHPTNYTNFSTRSKYSFLV